MASVLRAAVGRAASLLSNAVSGASRASLSALKQTSQPNTCHASSRPLSTCLMHQRIVLSSSAIRPCNLSMIPPSNLTLGSTSVLSNRLAPAAVSFTQTRSYHVRLALRRRCASCYFTRRKGRLYVECKAKPRHKQMQMMSKHKLWREDYSKGNVRRAVWWKYNEEKRYYKLGDNQWSRYDWLKGKIGVTV